MASKYINLTAQEKDEIRRLTQLANRRIKFAEKEYKRSGGDVLPREVVGGLQVKEKWATPSTPISRSVRFESEKEYRKQLQFLRSFDPKATKQGARPSISQYTLIQRDKTRNAIETSFGQEVSGAIDDKIARMTAPQLSEFWNTFANKSAKLGLKYSSGDAIRQTITELFPEDADNLLT